VLLQAADVLAMCFFCTLQAAVAAVNTSSSMYIYLFVLSVNVSAKESVFKDIKRYYLSKL
jgi:hypothetical protein